MKNSFKIVMLFLALFCVSFDSSRKETIQVVIDVAHGGEDSGATFLEWKEKDIVNQIASKIKSQNQNANVEIDFTRNQDDQLSLEQRLEKIRKIKPDFVICLHVNNNNDFSKNGFGVFVPENTLTSKKSMTLATNFVESFSNKTNLVFNEIKPANYFILRKSEYPTILLELGFLSNENNRNLITNEDGQNKIAAEILMFIENSK